jgi:hypothetical protein
MDWLFQIIFANFVPQLPPPCVPKYNDDGPLNNCKG